MRVYVKEENKQSIMIRIFTIIVFLAVPIGMFMPFFKNGQPVIDSIKNALDSLKILALFLLLFLLVGLYCLYILIKPPKGYKVKLIEKDFRTYNGESITSMKFHAEKEDARVVDFECYTIGENNLFVGRDYILKIKEFNWTPKYVEEVYDYDEK